MAILLPPGYDLGHVYMGKGQMWGIGELNLERTNRAGVKYRTVMGNFFQEVERAVRQGVAFDLLWDLPATQPKGYREVVRVREDGKVEVDESGRHSVLDGPRQPARPRRRSAAPQRHRGRRFRRRARRHRPRPRGRDHRARLLHHGR